MAAMVMCDHRISGLYQVKSQIRIAPAMLCHAMGNLNDAFDLGLVGLPETNKDEMPIVGRQSNCLRVQGKDLRIGEHGLMDIRRPSVVFMYLLTSRTVKRAGFLPDSGYNMEFETGILTPQIYTLSIFIN